MPTRARATLVFTAHSIPSSMAERYPYQEQSETTARLIAGRLRASTGLPLPAATVYQSRSGRPEDPWLGPDVCDFLRDERSAGRLDAAVVVPAGFLSDHIEVLYDLDTEAAAVAAELGVPMVRARAVNDHPAFLDLLAEVVRATVDRYAGGQPLPFLPPQPADRGQTGVRPGSDQGQTRVRPGSDPIPQSTFRGGRRLNCNALMARTVHPCQVGSSARRKPYGCGRITRS